MRSPKKGLKNFFSGVLQQKRSSKIFLKQYSTIRKKRSSRGFWRFKTNISTLQETVLSSAEDRAILEDLRPQYQGQRLDLQDQGL